MNRIKLLVVFLVTLLLSPGVLAHPGHGIAEPHEWFHFIQDYSGMILVIVGVLALLFFPFVSRKKKGNR